MLIPHYRSFVIIQKEDYENSDSTMRGYRARDAEEGFARGKGEWRGGGGGGG